MPVIRLHTTIQAPADVVFNLSRSVDLHVQSTAQTKERAIAGRTSGLMEPGETVTWEAKHFGVTQKLTSRITEYNYPHNFADEMVTGAFKSFKHEHIFEYNPPSGLTVMTDVFTYCSPLGVLGKLADVLFLKKYMTHFLMMRNRIVKEVAEDEVKRDAVLRSNLNDGKLIS